MCGARSLWKAANLCLTNSLLLQRAQAPFRMRSLVRGAGLQNIPQYYADSVVVAYRLPETDVPLSSLHPSMSSSGGDPDYAMLTDGDLQTATSIAIPSPGNDAWIQYAFPRAVSLRAVSLVVQDPSREDSMVYGIAAPQKALEASDDGRTWHTVATLDTERSPETTVSFPMVSARYFRVTFHREISSHAAPSAKRWMQARRPRATRSRSSSCIQARG